VTAHLEDCNNIGYRLRRATVDIRQKSVTLITAAMVTQDGVIQPAFIQDQPATRNLADLDPNTQRALQKAVVLISEQMKLYDRGVQGDL
jgi:hypothetical protein